METETITSNHPDCDDCTADAETVSAAYRLADGTNVCDTHLCIRAEEVA